MPNLLGALMQLTRDDMTFGNDFRQLACGPLFAARHVNAANDSVVPSLKSLVGGSQVPAHRSGAAQGCPYNPNLTLNPYAHLCEGCTYVQHTRVGVRLREESGQNVQRVCVSVCDNTVYLHMIET